MARPAPTVASPAPAIADTAFRSEMSLLNAGAEPRRALRYDFAEGAIHRSKSRMTNRIEVRVQIPGQPPAEQRTATGMLIFQSQQVLGIEPNGDFRLSEELRVEPDPETPATSPQEQQIYEALSGLTAELVISPLGQTRSTEWHGIDALEPQVQQFTRQVVENLKTVNQLPQEPVGVGAQWEVKQKISNAGLSFIATTRSTVTTLTEEGYTATVVSTLSHPPGQVEMPGLPPGTQVAIQRFAGTGSGTLNVRLDRPAPVHSAFNQTYTMVMKTKADGQEMTMELAGAQEINVEEEAGAQVEADAG